MTSIQSQTSVPRSLKEVYTFLEDLNNHQQLMPSTIYNWSSTRDEARFTIQNMAKLVLKVSSRTIDKEIILVPADEAPFDVELRWTLEHNADGTTTASHIINADLNMMMKMIASGPLQKLADYQVEKLKEIMITG